MMRKARTVIFTLPGGIFSHKTCSTLLTRSKPLAVPILPCRSSPFDALTMRSRSFCRLAPGASLQTTVILSVRAADAVPTPAVAFLRFFAVFLRFATLRLPASAEMLIVIVSDRPCCQLLRPAPTRLPCRKRSMN